jgi:hypothetical protein
MADISGQPQVKGGGKLQAGKAVLIIQKKAGEKK